MLNDTQKDPTERYLQENEYIKSLPVRIVPGTPTSYRPKSLTWLLKTKIFNLLHGTKTYLKELVTGRKYIVELKKLKGSRQNKRALVIGNGPSQGYLSDSLLQDIKNQGIEIFVVNFWDQNERLSSVAPDYLVISDPATLDMDYPDSWVVEKNENLLAYLIKHPKIKICCPIMRCKQLEKLVGKERVIGFIDAELRYWTNNISPIYPRGYLSMTLYKALSMAHWFKYEKIFVLGMDNTYPRNMYCNAENRILNHEIHAKTADFVTDQSSLYGSTGDLLVNLSDLFYDAIPFKENTINLDPYSLTNAFSKNDKIPLSINLFVK